ncbi:hypothetical protein [Shigella dysenteriae]|nr:hypothetical protein [Shigella dysenteriae]
MNVNAGHERTSKARIIHRIQLIRGITNCCLRSLLWISFTMFIRYEISHI